MKEVIIARPWPRLLTIELAADYVGVSRRTVEEWLEDGRLKSHELPGIRGRKTLDKIVIERTQLDRFVGLRPE